MTQTPPPVTFSGDTPATKPVWILAGPTASGKSALAIKLAQESDGVIINADSMQIYREIPILAAQPSDADKEIVPHLLYGFHSIAQNYSSAEWAERAATTIREIQETGKQPILVGGSGLYLKALTEGFSPMPEIPPAVRKHISDLYDFLGPNSFHQTLSKIDPVTAARLHPTDRQRNIRAREVYEVSGEPFSVWQAREKQSPGSDLTFRSAVLLPERTLLHEQINTRFIQMIDEGALDEARRVKEMDLNPDMTGAQALGLRALIDHLDGRLTMGQAITMGQTQTRQYAKRQYTWFRGQALPESIAVTTPKPNWFDDCLRHFTRLN